MGGGHAGEFGMVVGRRHLHAIHAHEGQVGEGFEDGEHLVAAQTTGFGGAGAGGKGRVEAVDVEAEIEGGLAGGGPAFPHAGEERLQLALVLEAAQVAGAEAAAATVVDVIAGEAVAGGADADLGEQFGQHQVFLHRLVHPGAVAAGFTEVVAPGVGVGVEVQHRQGAAEGRAVGAQQGQGE